jgi:ABC-type siderophore export system fused ATPase/permease subunit
MKKILTITFSVLLLFVIGLYLGIVCLLPPIINSKITINKLQSLILEKTGTETDIAGLNLKISPKLTVILNIDSLDF